MKVVIAGGTGFLGRALVAALAARQHDAVVLTRRADPPGHAAKFVRWNPDGSAAGEWLRAVDGADAVVNLAGEGIADRRWTQSRKQALRESRILATRSLVSAVRTAAKRPSVFVQGSAVGYYGLSDEATLDESYPPGQDFLGQLAVAWEAEAHPVAALGCRLVFMRSGVVLAKHGGALPKMRRPFLFFVGGPVASGRQYLSWIHLDDWTAIIIWAIEHESVSGVFNATSPAPVTNADFSRAIGRAARRPSWIPVPGFAMRLLFGEMGDTMLVHGQRVVPRRAVEQGFEFRHPDIDAALRHL
jgi:uncharacterized protein (TIGR01777 family)